MAVGGAENREVQIENGKIFLPGTLTLPTERKKPVALAVLLAGSGPCDRNETIGPNALLRDLADSLALHGHCLYPLRQNAPLFMARRV